MIVSFNLPMPPSTNNLYATAGKGRVKTSQYRSWISRAGWEIKAQWPTLPHFVDQVECRIRLPVASRIDIDNIKALPDLLTYMRVIQDDKQIQRLTIDGRQALEPGRCEVSVLAFER
jgi:Holliday junction resolvase RusA-like endonuclease